MIKIQGTFLKEETIKMAKIKIKKCTIMIWNILL